MLTACETIISLRHARWVRAENASKDTTPCATSLKKTIHKPKKRVRTQRNPRKDSKGQTTQKAEMLLHSASEASFITLVTCNTLGLRTGKINEPVTGLNEMKSQVTQDCHVVITSRHSNLRINVHCLVVPKITNELPSFKLESSQLEIPMNIKLADPYYHAPSKVEILIGAEFFHNILGAGDTAWR